jgi:hypothetical protein
LALALAAAEPGAAEAEEKMAMVLIKHTATLPATGFALRFERKIRKGSS